MGLKLMGNDLAEPLTHTSNVKTSQADTENV